MSFDFLHNQIMLTASTNGRGAYRFLLDTGTHGSTIDLRLARRLGLPLAAPETPVAGVGRARVPGRRTVCETLSVGGLTVHGLTVTALDLQQPARELGRSIDGVLGSGFLAPRITQIDYFRRRIRFYSEPPFATAAQPPDSSGRISFPMQFRAGSVLPVLEQCRVNGLGAQDFILTLDYPHRVVVLESAWDPLAAGAERRPDAFIDNSSLRNAM